MFAQRTVFVIGAGCSREYGIPIGDGLRDKIVEKLGQFGEPIDFENPNLPIFLQAIWNVAGNLVQDWCGSAKSMAVGLGQSSSIDRYLNFHQSKQRIVTIGKLSIVEEILKAESEVLLF